MLRDIRMVFFFVEVFAMSDKAWKRAERLVAMKCGGTRNPLSGRSGKHTSGDVIHPAFYFEVKQRQSFSLFTLWRSTAKKARKEGKIPVVVLHERRSHTRLYCLDESTAIRFLNPD